MSDGLDRRLQQLAALIREIAREHGAAGARQVGRIVGEALRDAEPAPATARPSGIEAPRDRARYAEIIGDSPALLRVLAILDRVADSEIPVLIQGESGTGKELIARAVHFNSARRGRPYLSENCAAIPETLQESELFGSKRGAFTGADRERKGLFESADHGTLFLDEVGDMSPTMQKKLLRALQDGEIRPVGGAKSIRVDVRIVSASNRDLRDMVRDKRFREDLYYRLNGITIELPPLRERREDVPALAVFFLQRAAVELGRPAPELTADAMTCLRAYAWPGNIRELDNEIRRCMALLGPDHLIGPDHFSPEVRVAADPGSP